jgi:hypothetical membrane protein
MARPKRISERLVALFLLGVVLMFPPLLGVFNQQLRPFGLPLLYFYLFVAWAALILLTAAVVRSIGTDDNDATSEDIREVPHAEERADA